MSALTTMVSSLEKLSDLHSLNQKRAGLKLENKLRLLFMLSYMVAVMHEGK